MITFADFDKLALTVAELLTGRAVAVRWRRPALMGTIGAASKFIDRFVIEVDPDLELDQALSVFLHECAHVLLHGDQMKISALAVRPSASRVGDCVYDQGYYTRESEADQLAAYWLAEAREKTYMLTPYRLLEALKKLYSQ